jgi:hypothetical protein
MSSKLKELANMQFRRINNQTILFDGNKPIRQATKEECIEIEYKSSLEYKVSRMTFKDLLDAYVKFTVAYSHGYHHPSSDARHTMEVYYKELLKRGHNL